MVENSLISFFAPFPLLPFGGPKKNQPSNTIEELKSNATTK